MDDSDFSFNFPELELGDLEEASKDALDKINEYLDGDIEDAAALLLRLQDFEARLDAALSGAAP